jgi:hypothetical protein
MSLGIPGLWARMRRVPLPKGVPDEAAFLEVWLSPYLPLWEYVPLPVDGPYRLIHSSDPDMIHEFKVSDDFVELLQDLCRLHMPAQDEVALILDEHCQIILGWRWEPDGPQAGPVQWMGCKFAFGLMEKFIEPAAVMIYETQAYEARTWYLNGTIKEYGHG